MADVLSRKTHYNSIKLELVQPVNPSWQIEAIIRAQAKQPKTMPNEVIKALKTDLKDNDWFNNHKNDFTLYEGLCRLEGNGTFLRANGLVLRKSHDSTTAWLGFVKTLHLIKC